MSLNISLPAELENRVRQHVASGMYGSASEVIREALRLFEAYQAVQAASLQALRADIGQGIAEARAGRVSSVAMNDIKAKGRAVLRGKAAD
jgi:antitoxin ParD1/3/4